MRAYINGVGLISPQGSWPVDPNASVASHAGDHLNCIEPDYQTYLSAQQLRRMSRILKMGTTAALMALRDAGIEKPEGIITGTGYGCLEDTGIFLTKISEQHEEALNPTPFMQSTHNTIGSLIALLLQCTGYNQTFVQGAFSFEHALIDALMLLNENQSSRLLVGGVDEWTSVSHQIKSRFRKYRHSLDNSMDLFSDKAQGTIAGEGAGYFVLSGTPSSDSVACIRAVETSYTLDQEMIQQFLRTNGLSVSEVDVIFLGKSGDNRSDQELENMVSSALSGVPTALFKHLCGEYATATTFAMALAVQSFRHEPVRTEIVPMLKGKKITNALICNSYFRNHHSLILLETC